MYLGHYQPLQPWVITWTTCTAQGCPEAGLPPAITSGHPSEWREKAREHCMFIPKICAGWRETLSSSESNTTSTSWCSVSLWTFPFLLERACPQSEDPLRGPGFWLWCKETGFESCTHVSSGLPLSLRSDQQWALYWHRQLFYFSVNMQIFSGCRHSVKCLLTDLYSGPHQLPSDGPFPLPPSLFS